MKLVRLIKMYLNETYSRVWVGKHFRRVQVIQDGLKLNGTYQLLVYADDDNILDGSIHTVKKNTEAFVVASQKIGLDINAKLSTRSCPKIRMQDKVTI
jgi:hypothetical protein